jgi:hypothetical protein
MLHQGSSSRGAFHESKSLALVRAFPHQIQQEFESALEKGGRALTRQSFDPEDAR